MALPIGAVWPPWLKCGRVPDGCIQHQQRCRTEASGADHRPAHRADWASGQREERSCEVLLGNDRGGVSAKPLRELFDGILGAKWSRKNDRDYLRFGDGREVRLSHASFGQQEVLPLPLLLARFHHLGHKRGRAVYIDRRPICSQKRRNAWWIPSLQRFLDTPKQTANTLSITERQRIVRLVVKEIIVNGDTIAINRCIPISDGRDAGNRPGYRLCMRGDLVCGSQYLSGLRAGPVVCQEDPAPQRGASQVVRYADDFVVCFAYRREARAFEKALSERLVECGLPVAPEKTRMLRFGINGGSHNERFDFLGFEFYWGDRSERPAVDETTHGDPEMAREHATDDRMDTGASTRTDPQADARVGGEAAGHVELLRAAGQFASRQSVRLRDAPNGLQVAQSARSEPKLHLGGLEPTAGAFPGAARADRGKDGARALPDGVEFLSADREVPGHDGKPRWVCESELT